MVTLLAIILTVYWTTFKFSQLLIYQIMTENVRFLVNKSRRLNYDSQFTIIKLKNWRAFLVSADRHQSKTFDDTAWHGFPPGSDSLPVFAVGFHFVWKPISDLEWNTPVHQCDCIVLSIFKLQMLKTGRRFQSEVTEVVSSIWMMLQTCSGLVTSLLVWSWTDIAVFLHSLNTFPGDKDKEKD